MKATSDWSAEDQAVIAKSRVQWRELIDFIEAGGPIDLIALRAVFVAGLEEEQTRVRTSPVEADVREARHMTGVHRQLLACIDALEAGRFKRARVLVRQALRRPPREVTDGRY